MYINKHVSFSLLVITGILGLLRSEVAGVIYSDDQTDALFCIIEKPETNVPWSKNVMHQQRRISLMTLGQDSKQYRIAFRNQDRTVITVLRRYLSNIVYLF
jgi:hypothetical protein